MTDKKAQLPSRREFFKTASLGAAAAAAATAVLGVAPAEAVAPSDSQGYQETAHVKRYYDLAKQF
jgi:nitrous oxide reductase